ncbi:AGC/AKT protein kinase [Obelidium mucronatum]|nr:AGC/AKT protein kinase [Obelidium mucronatum]
MFKLLKKTALDGLLAKTKNLGLSSRPQSANSSKPGTPKEMETSQMTLAAPSKEDLSDSKDVLVVESVGSSSQSLNTSQQQQVQDAQQQQQQQQQQPREFDTPGLLSIRVVETRNLNLLAKASKDAAPVMPFLVLEFDKNETMAWAKETKLEHENGKPISGHAINWNFRANFDVSRESDLIVTVYQKNAAKNGDTPIGTTRISPAFDQRLQDEWFKLSPVNNSSNSNGTTAPSTPTTNAGEIRIQLVFKQNGAESEKRALSVDDFEILRVLGKGSFGKVVQVKKKDTGRIYAMKILKKSSIVERDEVQHTLAERNVLAKVSHPFIVNIKFSFQSKDKLYLVLAFVNGGELFHHLQLEGRFEEDRAKLYAAELLSALECLHSFNIIYRDLKPENILLDYSGHIALCDFGLCKFNMKDGNKTNTFCGTPEYLAPELLLGHGYTKCVDYWTLGVLIYEMITGLPPFYDENQNEMYKRIVSDELVFPDELGDVVKDLLTKMLNRDPTSRLGNNGAEEIKRHPWFADINWQRLNARKYRPSFRPEVANSSDTSNFDQEFTSELPQDSYVDPSNRLADSQQSQFDGFSYRGDPMGSVQVGSLMNRVEGGGGSDRFPGLGSLPRGAASLRKENGLRKWD